MPYISANNWESPPNDFKTGFGPEKQPAPELTTEEVIASMDEVAKWFPPIDPTLLFPRKQ